MHGLTRRNAQSARVAGLPTPFDTFGLHRLALMTRSGRYLVAALFLAAIAFANASRGEIIVSEIMFNPQGSDRDSTGSTYTYNREWAELYNTGPSAVDLSGWQFGDSADNNWATAFPLGTTLAANQALVVTGDIASFDANWGGSINRIQVGAFPNLANNWGDNEAAAIRNASGVLQDVVRFEDTGWPTANGSDGNSIFLLPNALTSSANDLATSWKPSSAGAYGARFTSAGGQGENHGSPGQVTTQLNAPFAPSPDAAWSMVVFPDTQNYSKSSRDLPIFSQMTNWVVDNKDQYKIKLVMQEGDLVNNNDTETPSSGDQTGDQQWANARAAMSILDGHVPYIITAGNHDLGTTSAQTRDTQFNDYFNQTQNPLNDPALGGILKGYKDPGKLENAYFELKAPDGRDLLIFSLEFWPRQSTVAWANQIADLPQYQDHAAVLLTHSYLNHNNTRTNAGPTSYPGISDDYNDGEQLWQELVKLHPNFEMTFSGHVGGDGIAYLKSTGIEGNSVHQMLINAQFETNGGNGWFRIVEFLKDGKTARVRTFSPFLGYARTNAANDYTITLSSLYEQIADYDQNGVVDAGDLAKWRSNLGMTDALQFNGDGDGDGDVDGSDFLAWQRKLGAAAATAVPEPSAAFLMAAVGIGLAVRRRER
jgi:hypothetical protein